MASPNELQAYILATSLMAAFLVAAVVRLWLLRRVEEKLLKNKDDLENQILSQQKDLHTARQESNAWRTEMQRQFDIFRHMASDQLSVEEKRFTELLATSTRREHELQTALDIAKQMCNDLPAAKARVLHLESLFNAPPTTENHPGGGQPSHAVTPMPDLSGDGAAIPSPFIPGIQVSPISPLTTENMIFVDQEKSPQKDEKLAEADQKRLPSNGIDDRAI